MIFDATTRTGATARARLESETLAWLTTVDRAGKPAASLIWFLWHDGELIIYSQETPKVRNIAANPNVAFNLNSDDGGGSVLTITGTARVDRSFPSANELAPYIEKYAAGIAGLGMTPAEFAVDYSVPIRITPTSYRAW